MMLPLHFNVKDKNVLVVGGGKIALRRLRLFLEEGARITVISPDVVPEIAELSKVDKLNWQAKKVELADLKDALFIIAATNDSAVNEWIAENASENQLVNVASNANKGNVIVPKSVKKGRLTLSVSTNGASPTLAKQICEQLSKQFDEQFVNELEQMYENRANRKRNK
ncbi:bifunctional precorrin-2 dehydrogenase/sirohydrochlorin ferrochelatase [Metabacillus litoralis]|jgi:precorrin-2 dehydrogenase / sirohydrochlorin ferrochelatase|uniref:precorrin-2 dehydrogenase/sirohydrochlorin ferrochelatase family protein n=1 Tax=Metabacillus litoralis TaxID=152268 RepID=UPI00203F7E66|nr:NAD(P)-dependent oxidoreductase [Metabacillus litoralis]